MADTKQQNFAFNPLIILLQISNWLEGKLKRKVKYFQFKLNRNAKNWIIRLVQRLNWVCGACLPPGISLPTFHLGILNPLVFYSTNGLGVLFGYKFVLHRGYKNLTFKAAWLKWVFFNEGINRLALCVCVCMLLYLSIVIGIYTDTGLIYFSRLSVYSLRF